MIKHLPLLLLLFALTLSKKLLFVQQLFRHGARYPIYQAADGTTATDPTLMGELTSQGKHMQYILGKIMYQQYWKPLFADTDNLNKYNPSLIYVKSTNFNRTIESAQSQLLGLLQDLPPYQLPIDQLDNSLPPFANSSDYRDPIQNQSYFNVFGSINTDFHTVPIHTERDFSPPAGSGYKYKANPYDEGDFLTKFDFTECPNQHFWGKQNLLSDPAMQIKRSPEVASFLHSLSNAVGTSIKYEEAYKYIDQYQCQLYLGLPYDPLFDDPQMYRTAEFVFLSSTLFQFLYTQVQIRTSNTALLQATVRNIHLAIEGSGPQLVLYSAHDTTILSFAAALNMVNLDCIMANFYQNATNQDSCISQYPAFATNFVLQLWQQDDQSYTIRILYNGVARAIPICSNKQDCPLSEFQTWTNSFYLQSPNLSCGIREQYTKLYIVIGVLSVFVLIFIIVSMHSRFKKKIEEKMLEMEEKKGYIENFEDKEGGTIH